MTPPRKSIGLTDVVIIVCVAAFGIFGGQIWPIILLGCAMAITIAAWRTLWYVGAIYDRMESTKNLDASEDTGDDRRLQ